MKANWNKKPETQDEQAPRAITLSPEEKAERIIDLISKLYSPLTKSEWFQISNAFESGKGDTWDEKPYELFDECLNAALRRAK